MPKSHNRKAAMEDYILLQYFTLMLECSGFVSCIVTLWKKGFCTVILTIITIIVIIKNNNDNKTNKI